MGRLLRLFTDIRKGEAPTALLLTLNGRKYTQVAAAAAQGQPT